MAGINDRPSVCVMKEEKAELRECVLVLLLGRKYKNYNLTMDKKNSSSYSSLHLGDLTRTIVIIIMSSNNNIIVLLLLYRYTYPDKQRGSSDAEKERGRREGGERERGRVLLILYLVRGKWNLHE